MMKFYLYTKHKEKVIQIVMKEDGRKKQVLALIPYHGGLYSFEYNAKLDQAVAVKDFLEKENLENQRRLTEIAKRYCINAPWFYVKPT